MAYSEDDYIASFGVMPESRNEASSTEWNDSLSLIQSIRHGAKTAWPAHDVIKASSDACHRTS